MRSALLIGTVGILVTLGQQASAQQFETEIVMSSIDVLRELTQSPDRGIPNKLLREAAAVGIFPGVIKAGFIVGGRHGRGVLAVRNEDGSWSNPLPLVITGGSVGFQAGAEAVDLVLVFRTRRGVDNIINGRGKLKLGGDISISAGPVGRESGAATDARLESEIFSYSRSRGLFAGASLSGSSIRIDYTALEIFYGTDTLTPRDIVTRLDIPARESAVRLRETLAALSPPQTPPPPSAETPPAPTPPAATPSAPTPPAKKS